MQLTTLSRSPSVVSVALQLSNPEDGKLIRLTDKFPSSTTLWMLLRKFESVPDSQGHTYNFTARAIPRIEKRGDSPQGLSYERPVIALMGRELVSFTDLQKTLAQLGFNAGSVLLRLSFQVTIQPLEEAMIEIDKYFKSMEGEDTGKAHAPGVKPDSPTSHATKTVLNEQSNNSVPVPEPPMSPKPSSSSPSSTSTPFPAQIEDSTPHLGFRSDRTVIGPAQRPITVFAPPSASTPAAARQAYNEKDYEPTIDHAKLHQSRLATYGRNKTLPSDQELAVQAEIQAKKEASIKSVNIKIRFPDQSSVITTFSNVETSETLYRHVKGLLQNEDEPFSLNFSTTKGPKKIPKESEIRLITGLGMVGNVLVNVLWDGVVSGKATMGQILKERYREKASEIKVKELEGVEVEEKESKTANGKAPEKRAGEKKGGTPKWLKLPGKK